MLTRSRHLRGNAAGQRDHEQQQVHKHAHNATEPASPVSTKLRVVSLVTAPPRALIHELVFRSNLPSLKQEAVLAAELRLVEISNLSQDVRSSPSQAEPGGQTTTASTLLADFGKLTLSFQKWVSGTSNVTGVTSPTFSFNADNEDTYAVTVTVSIPKTGITFTDTVHAFVTKVAPTIEAGGDIVGVYECVAVTRALGHRSRSRFVADHDQLLASAGHQSGGTGLAAIDAVRDPRPRQQRYVGDRGREWSSDHRRQRRWLGLEPNSACPCSTPAPANNSATSRGTPALSGPSVRRPMAATCSLPPVT